MARIEYESYRPDHLSYSTVNGYRSCGARFRFQKILKLEERPGLAAIGGNAVHSATEVLDLADFYGISVEEVLQQRTAEASSRGIVDIDNAVQDTGLKTMGE